MHQKRNKQDLSKNGSKRVSKPVLPPLALVKEKTWNVLPGQKHTGERKFIKKVQPAIVEISALPLEQNKNEFGSSRQRGTLLKLSLSPVALHSTNLSVSVRCFSQRWWKEVTSPSSSWKAVGDCQVNLPVGSKLEKPVSFQQTLISKNVPP